MGFRLRSGRRGITGLEQSTPFGGVFAARMIHQDLPHGPDRDVDEVGAAFHIKFFHLEQAQRGFVDQGGGLQSVAAALAAHQVRRHGREFLLGRGEQSVEGTSISSTAGHGLQAEGIAMSGVFTHGFSIISFRKMQ